MNEPLLRAPRQALPCEPAMPGSRPAWPQPAPYWTCVAIVRSHKICIALVTCLFALLGYLCTRLATPQYQASMLVQVDESSAPTDRLLGETPGPAHLRGATAPEIEVMRSRFVVARAVDSLNLFIEAGPRYLPLVGRWLAGRSGGLSKPVLPGLAGYVWGAERVTVASFEVPPALFGSTFELRAGAGASYLLVNEDAGLRLPGRVGEPARWQGPRGEIALTVTDLRARPGARFVLRRVARLDTIENLQQDLDIAEQGKQSGVIKVGLRGEDPERLALILNEIGRQYIGQNEERRSAGAGKALAFVEQQLPALKQAVESAESSYNRMRNQFGSVDLGEEAKTLLQQAGTAQARLLDLQQKRTDLSSRYTADHPLMVTVNEQIDALNRDVAQLNTRTRRLPQVEQDIVRLARDVKVGTEVYTAALSSAQQLRLSAANRIGNARVLDPAEIPASPVRQRTAVVVGAAAALGLLLASLGAGLRQGWQWRVHAPSEVEQQLGFAVVATVAATPSPASVLLPQAQLHDGAAEGLRRLRPLLQRTLASGDNRVVLVAGPGAGVGKSFVAANLAAVLGVAGKRVLLVDADLRGGHLHLSFGAAPGPGLAEYLAGGPALPDIVHARVLPHVDLIAAGAPPPDPSELLAGDAMRELLRSLAPAYDCVVIDTAPVLSASDALALAPLAAVTLNVVRSRVTTAAEIDESMRQLRMAGAQVAGVVLNGWRARAWGAARGRARGVRALRA
ncbi:MAG: GNVR domain-containing protein [Telluria sp.]